MLLLDRSHIKELLRFVTGIKSDIQYWSMVDVVLTGKTPHNVLLLGRRLEDVIANHEGVIYVHDKTRMLCFVRHQRPAQECSDLFAHEVIAQMPPKSCEVAVAGLTADQLQRVEIRFATSAEEQNRKPQQSTLYSLRATRHAPGKRHPDRRRQQGNLRSSGRGAGGLRPLYLGQRRVKSCRCLP